MQMSFQLSLVSAALGCRRTGTVSFLKTALTPNRRRVRKYGRDERAKRVRWKQELKFDPVKQKRFSGMHTGKMGLWTQKQELRLPGSRKLLDWNGSKENTWWYDQLSCRSAERHSLIALTLSKPHWHLGVEIKVWKNIYMCTRPTGFDILELLSWTIQRAVKQKTNVSFLDFWSLSRAWDEIDAFWVLSRFLSVQTT